MKKLRCAWSENHELLMHYHDLEWGVPIYDDQKLFEFLILEGAQAGLNWLTILKRRDNYRKAFANFNPQKIAKFTQVDIERLMQDEGIIRNRLKITSAIKNAQAYLNISKNTKFSDFIWQFVNHKPQITHLKRNLPHPVRNEQSDALSKALKKNGFSFVGTVICYAFMEAVGMINDHVSDCFRYKEIKHG